MDWIILLIAGLMEVVWSVGLKFTQGFTRLWPSLITVAAMVISMLLLGRALRTLPLGTAYAVWVGIGILGAAIGGVWFFKEALPPLRLFFLVLLAVSIAGLKLTTPSAPEQPEASAVEAAREH